MNTGAFRVLDACVSDFGSRAVAEGVLREILDLLKTADLHMSVDPHIDAGNVGPEKLEELRTYLESRRSPADASWLRRRLSPSFANLRTSVDADCEVFSQMAYWSISARIYGSRGWPVNVFGSDDAGAYAGWKLPQDIYQELRRTTKYRLPAHWPS